MEAAFAPAEPREAAGSEEEGQAGFCSALQARRVRADGPEKRAQGLPDLARAPVHLGKAEKGRTVGPAREFALTVVQVVATG